MYEKRHHALASRTVYYRRLGKSFLAGFLFLTLSLFGGVLGYKYICHLGWADSLLNASMILGGMGPVNIIENTVGKLFSSFYAIYSGVAFLGAFAVIIAPVIHRAMHQFHLEDK